MTQVQDDLPKRVAEIIERIAEEHETTLAAIIGPCRTKTLAQARFAAYHAVYTAQTNRGFYPSLPQVGRWFGGRDHTTVMHGISRHLNPEDPATVTRPAPPRCGPLSNVKPVDPDRQDEILSQWRELMRRKQG
jgi:hypothetical protein